MRCPRCDRKMPEDDRFCGRCGLASSKDGKPVDPLIGITVAGRYRIDRRIGVGGMGTVYLGVHERVGQKVAIKVLHERYAGDDQLTRRFEKEALTYGQVSHPNLVGLHDYGRTDDGTFFMVLEYCPGISLAQLIRRRGKLDATLAGDILIQLAQGLGAAHAMDIVHRDLKPENVILTRTRPGRYHARLLDFGIAKRLDDDGPRLTAAGMVFGTPEYMAPEQARGKAVDARSDIYALGCVAYEMFTGDPPFTGTDKLRIMHQQAGDPVEALSKRRNADDPPLSAAFEAVVMRCLAKSAKARYADTNALIEALERAMDTRLAQTGELVTRVRPTVEPPADGVPTAPNGPAALGALSSSAGPAALGTVPERFVDADGPQAFGTGALAGTVTDPCTASFSDRLSGGLGPLEMHDEPGFGDSLIEGLPTDVGRRTSGRHPSTRSLFGAAAVFVGVVAFSAWLFSTGDDAPAEVAATPAQVATAHQTTLPAFTQAVDDLGARQAAVIAQVERSASADAQAARAQAAEAAAQAAAQQKQTQAREAAEAKARAAAARKAEQARKKAAAEKKRKAEVARKKAEAEKTRQAELARKKAEAERKARIASARKALRLGKIDEAAKATTALKGEESKVDAAEVERIGQQIAAVRSALGRGKTAFDKADCVGALAALEPVLEIAPGTRGVSHMVNSCRNALPPRQL